MKKLIYIIFAGLLLMGSSCKDFLDLPSEKDFDSSTIFEEVGKVEMAVLGAYTSTFNAELFYQFGMGSDEVFSTEGETNSKNQVANYVYSPAVSPSSTYAAMYAGVEQANILIKNIPLMTGLSEADQAKVDMLLGEAYAIRAMNMLQVVRHFGDVPYPRVPVVEMETFASSRVSRDTILDGCVADLQTAIDLIPWKSESGLAVERITKNAAYGLLARVALYAAGYSLRWDLDSYASSSVTLARRSDTQRITELYEITRDACAAVVQRGENSLIDYETIFRDLVNGRYNSESMFEYGQLGEDRNELRMGYTNGMFAHQNSFYNKAQPAMAAFPTYYFEFKEGDLRRDVTIANYAISSDSKHEMNTYASNTIGKFRVNWKADQGVSAAKRNINWIHLRYADVLLMYAEAENELNNGPSGVAKEMLEQVRLRAFGDDRSKIGSIPGNYEGFKEAIMQERKLELGFEGWRRTDLIRWGILFEKLNEVKHDLLALSAHQGKYQDVDRYRAYKSTPATVFNDPVIAIDFIGLKEQPSQTEKAALENQGYTVLDMYGSSSLFFANALQSDAVWVQNIFRGLEKNKVELFPLSTSTIDNNPGLQGQQHPLY
ncbi:MAG: RagB/SusD family nutrient uptake outer membrane protein [Sphingobacterium sp.]|uniref:RagB/SusD family nutrient uptake outer membrane protein n=1 Tax=Sphingobacterium sp. JB170 TaxID=1434842 RepID=UPI00097E9601|nr:RagB/SusD family nutrient uptake outer membrane protein [Sphingobacterium sp. JB170]SJN34246.1 putative outer membrane protein, probably involved in nutrient binding [Sphingobacterium sp. JB170]